MFFRYFKIALTIKLLLCIPIVSYSESNVSGTNSVDSIRGTAGADILTGGEGDDILYGEDGGDELRGGAGDDVLIGGPGMDRLYGGLGADQFVFDLDAAETDEIFDFNPEDGDTLVFQWKDSTKKKLTSNNVKLDSKGNVKVKLGGKNWNSIVGIKRGNLVFKIEEKGAKAILKFSSSF